jgi:3-hydroxyisobutyrate dehydrogenase-like beta-hydroxyacid dehydrogenase
MSPSKPTIAILSIGQMGLGISTLLLAHSYRVITNVSDRSTTTQNRAKAANIECFDTDSDLVREADYIFSIVPPRDAVATALRVQDALGMSGKELWYADLNATSPATARSIAAGFTERTPHVQFLDGGIIGGPPRQNDKDGTWTKPDIPISGPQNLPDDHLASILNMRYIGAEIGSASGLKCCFAALSKGFTALSIQSYTTASNLNVLPHLQDYLEIYNPGARQKAERTIVGCTGKAYRWVEEMNQIGECFAVEGGFREQARVFREIAGVYQELADVVEEKGTEKMGDAEGAVGVLAEGLKGRKK